MSRVKVVAIVLLLVVGMVLGFLPGNAGVTNTDAQAASSQAGEPAPAALPTQPETDGGLTSYHSYRELSEELQQIALEHSDITKLVSIGKSYQGRDIWAMKVSDNPNTEESGEAEVYFNSDHHAREWMTIEIALYILNSLTNNYGTNATITSIVDNRQVWVIPTANPDGRVYDGINDGDDPSNHARQAYGWRKNMKDNNGNSVFEETQDGIDLNRNYDYMWGASGASSAPADDTYGGVAGFSEPETAVIRDFCRQHKFVFAISFHTYSQLILYPWGYTYASAPDEAVLSTVANQMAARITNTAGSAYPGYTPQQSSDLYMTSGTDDDWLYGELGIYAYCIEAYPNVNDVDAAVTGAYDLFHPRADKIPLVCRDVFGAAFYLCQISDNPYQVIDHVSVWPDNEATRIARGAIGTRTISVRDDGRRADSFTLTTSSISGWTISVSPSSQSLAANQTAQSTLSITVPSGASPGVYRIWVNATSTSNASCVDSCSVNVTVPWGDDVALYSQSPFADFEDYPLGNYSIRALVENEGTNSAPSFPGYCAITKFGATTPVTKFGDNMESGSSKWVVVDHDAATSPSYWQLVTGTSHTATHSWWCGPAGGGNYNDMTVQVLEMAQPVSLRGVTGANLTYWTYYTTESAYDFCVVQGSRDNGKTWEYITRYTGGPTAWTNRTTNLASFVGASQFKARILFTADEGTNAAGFWLDDVYVTADVPSESVVMAPTASYTNGTTWSGSMNSLYWTYAFTQGGMYRVTTYTAYSADTNASNNATDTIIVIDPSRTLPAFAGADRVENLGYNNALKVVWYAAASPNMPIVYSVRRFDHSPGEAEINGTSPIGTTDQLYYQDENLTNSATYYYVVRAEDSLAQKEYNLVVKSGSPEPLLFFQVQYSIDGYRDLTLDPFEGIVQTLKSVSLASAGQYKFGGTNDSWLSGTFAEAKDMSGNWTFRVFGRTDNGSANGYLYAKVYKYSDSSPFFTTGQDDENLASYMGGYHEFAWTYNVPAGTTLAAGDRFYVELWLNVSSVTSGAASTTYTFAGVNRTSGPHDGFFCDVDDSTNLTLVGPYGNTTVGNSTREFYDSEYPNVTTSNDVRASQPTTGTGDEHFVKFSFKLNESASWITSATFNYEARYGAAGTATMYIWNASTSTWNIVGATLAYALNTDAWMNRTLTGNFANYLVQGSIVWGVYCSVSATTCGVDCALTSVSFIRPSSTFTFAYDFTSNPSSIAPSLKSSAQSSPWINISVVAGWNMISVPLVGPTPMPGALTDKADGGSGLVQWDRAQAYTPGAPGNIWGQYYTGWASSLNDLTAVNHTVGIWINVTSLGDGLICLGGSGYTNSTNASISLSAGWNLIGYPARNDASYTVGQLRAATFATVVEGFNSTQTYRTISLADGTVMKRGQAYWVYVPAPTVWWVDW